MTTYPQKVLGYILLFVLSMTALSVISQTVEGKLEDILTKRSFDDSLIKDKTRSVSFAGVNYVLDDKGILHKEGGASELEIYYNPATGTHRSFLIEDKSAPKGATNPLSTISGDHLKNAEFEDLVRTQRQYGIYDIKSKNPQCYFAYAKLRLGDNALERILALERPDSPRPLIFMSDSDWQDFQNDIRNVFAPFRGPDSYVVLIGTSTTFFSENPLKGQNAPLFEKAPDCLKRAADPKASLDVYTFDTPGFEISDLDIHLFIPELSDLCNKATVGGNNGKRTVYWQNTMDQCLSVSSNEEIRNMVKALHQKTSGTLRNALIPGSALSQFLDKWTDKLNKREIHFSVSIRPDERAAPLFKPETTFANESHLKRRFIIPIH